MTAALALLKHWKLILGGLALSAVLIWGAIQKMEAQHEHKLRVAAEQNLIRFAAEVNAKTAKAKADDLAHARDVEQRNEAIRQEHAHDLETKLADARALAARYLERLRRAPEANPGGGGQSSVPGAGNAAGPAAEPGAEAVVAAADVEICTEAVIKLEGWQDWFKATQKVER